jgi:type I restriction enzyme, R subunit
MPKPCGIGSNGAGRAGGAGNPRSVLDNYSVSYLWEDIWRRDNRLEILQRFVHVQGADKKTGKVSPHTSQRIFPRFHQWHAVRELVKDARERGAGRSYLVEHSAGSGKSNTIAWLAHRLSNLFGDDNQPVFHEVIVITDRVVLDRQLQRTIYQFDHTPGVVKKIDADSAQLAGALDDATSKIVISTLQMYPYVLDKIADAGLGGQRYGVIIDEAHSSQGGDAAARLKQALGVNVAAMEEDEDPAESMTRARGPQPNLSYFAFTAIHRGAPRNRWGSAGFSGGRGDPRCPRSRPQAVPARDSASAFRSRPRRTSTRLAACCASCWRRTRDRGPLPRRCTRRCCRLRREPAAMRTGTPRARSRTAAHPGRRALLRRGVHPRSHAVRRRWQ